MIVEGAFYKLPELLIGHMGSRQYEVTVTSHVAMAMLLELGARNVQMAQQRIHVECPYPGASGRQAPTLRADLFVDFSGLLPGLWHGAYGMRSLCWLEAKLFGSIGKVGGNETKTENVGHVLGDIIRLLLLVPEEQSAHRTNSRYLLLVFNRPPGRYLALSDNAGASREWLSALLTSGSKKLVCDLRGEKKSLIAAALPRPNLGSALSLTFEATTYAFEPSYEPSQHLYWGYLVRLRSFALKCDGGSLRYDDSDGSVWTAEHARTQDCLADRFFGVPARSHA